MDTALPLVTKPKKRHRNLDYEQKKHLTFRELVAGSGMSIPLAFEQLVSIALT
jgi:hypothetical protein